MEASASFFPKREFRLTEPTADLAQSIDGGVLEHYQDWRTWKADALTKLQITDKEAADLVHLAVFFNEFDLFNELLKVDSIVSALPKLGSDALLCAVRNNFFGMAKVLLKHNVDVNGRDNSGHTPVYMAVRQGCLPMVKLLLKYAKVDLNLEYKERGKRFPVIALAIAKGHTEIAHILRAHSANEALAGTYQSAL